MKPLILAMLLGGFAFGAGAQTPAPAPAGDQAAATAAIAAKPDNAMPADAAQADHAPGADRNCLQQTGSHIGTASTARRGKAGKAPQCINASGRAYTRDDIDRTGATDVASALRMLDPAVH